MEKAFPANTGLSATTDPRPHLIALPDEIAGILNVPAADRTADQVKALTAFFRTLDPVPGKLRAAIAEAKKPVPEPENLSEARKALADLLALPPVSPRLANLESDVALSASQAAQARLTAAQDLAWALINSRAFLFNY